MTTLTIPVGVFDVKKRETLRCGRMLSGNDQAADLHRLAMLYLSEFSDRSRAGFRERIAPQLSQMRVETHAGEGKAVERRVASFLLMTLCCSSNVAIVVRSSFIDAGSEGSHEHQICSSISCSVGHHTDDADRAGRLRHISRGQSTEREQST